MTVRCKSVTHAMKGKDILSKNNIPAVVQKEIKSMGAGCIYTVQFADQYKIPALQLLQTGGVILHKTEKDLYGEDTL